MKVWAGYGSEHSYSLVLIGHFADEGNARKAEQKFQRLRVAAESELPDIGWDADQRFTTGMHELLDELRTWDLSRSDIDNFAFDHSVERQGAQIRIDTDEGEVQGLLKVLVGEGARVEVFSSHHWTDDGQPRRGEQDESDPEAQDAPEGADQDALDGEQSG